MHLDPAYDHYHRRVYAIQNWLVSISGISRAIMITGLFASQFISHNIFKTALIENLFMRSNYEEKKSTELTKAKVKAEKAMWTTSFKKMHVLDMVNVICQL